MKRFGLLLFVLVSVLGTSPTFAHVEKTDGGTVAILHIEPGEDPVAGTPTTFLFNVASDEKTLDLNQCDCTATLKKDGVLFSGPLTKQEELTDDDHLFSFGFTTTPPETGTYRVTLTGKGDYPTFTMSWDVQINKSAPKSVENPLLTWLTNTNNTTPLLIAGIVLIVGVAVYQNRKALRR